LVSPYRYIRAAAVLMGEVRMLLISMILRIGGQRPSSGRVDFLGNCRNVSGRSRRQHRLF
jgi:hypothetical protein